MVFLWSSLNKSTSQGSLDPEIMAVLEEIKTIQDEVSATAPALTDS